MMGDRPADHDQRTGQDRRASRKDLRAVALTHGVKALARPHDVVAAELAALLRDNPAMTEQIAELREELRLLEEQIAAMEQFRPTLRERRAPGAGGRRSGDREEPPPHGTDAPPC
jgi:hypothetical protein